MHALGGEHFTLLDIGCSGGIHESWLAFGDRLTAYGFDPNIEEVQRLNAARPFAGIEYINGFVGLEPNHPFQAERKRAGLYGGNIWNRLSIAKSQQIRQQAKQLTNQEQTAQNFWSQVELADPARPIFIREFLQQRAIPTVDFIKLDVDGADFDVLHSLEPVFASHDVLGFQMEVNLCGRADSADHTFHNTDGFLRKVGFELVDLTTTRYSLAALPGRYLYTFPAQAAKGRPYQGDALYVRDRAWLEKEQLPLGYPVAKLLKLAALFYLRGLEDHAAEVLVNLRKELDAAIDVDAALDELATEAMDAAGFEGEPRTYRRYIELFEADDPRFYTSPRPVSTSVRMRLADWVGGRAR